ncbi:hypothetical protein CP556_14865 [Natrinema sp. CBA1119]|uniref:hypothetical protein n=1 Tax=Natrinema sp. CBA1119 TaxID=1608465 RepID=UPI000BF311E3|nr:hypothetical protein [Natrinema sp. CBA1119]PGF17252.1 hypothetical protein CP556_14865 [Natrinema sp. CBA1119]
MTDPHRDESEQDGLDRIDRDSVNSLETADTQLEEVEQTLWDLSRQTNSAALVEVVDMVLTDLWALQHSLLEIQKEIDSHPESTDEDSFDRSSDK